jgi:hypothetical protein
LDFIIKEERIDMTTEATTVVLRKLTPSEGMVITDIETETMRAKEVYLGKEDSEDNYKEIDENTPLPEKGNDE